MIRYVFREPLTIKNGKDADAQTIGEALDAVRKTAGGELTPKAAVEAARDEKSPLHPHFEWDDAKAADHWRLEQARTLIRAVVTVDSDGEERPAYLSVTGKAGVSYRSIGDVMSSSDLQQRVLLSAERDLAAWEKRYREIADVCRLVSSARKKLSKKIERETARASA